MSAAFLPPLFSKLGTATKDLLTKKYDFKNQVGSKHNVSGDLNIETTATVGDAWDVSGNIKTKYKNKDFGEFEGEFNTGGALTGELKANKLHDGLTVVVKGTEKPNAKVSLEYRRESVSATVGTDVNFSGKTTAKLDASVVAGVDGFSVGGNVVYDADKSALDDYNFGAEYSEKDYTLTLKTAPNDKSKAKKADEVVASYFFNLPSKTKLKTQVGGQLLYGVTSKNWVGTVGSEHDVSEAATLKVKVDSDGALATAIEHRLANPALKVALSSSWALKKKTTTPDKFGAALIFGDF